MEDALMYSLTIEDELKILRITYPYCKLKHLNYFFMKKHEQVSNYFNKKILTKLKHVIRILCFFNNFTKIFFEITEF